MKYIILLLGAPNDEQGRLSQMAQDRIDCAYNLYANNEHMTFLCTGGYGQHFNTTNRPHAYYAKQALIKKGVKKIFYLLSYLPILMKILKFQKRSLKKNYRIC